MLSGQRRRCEGPTWEQQHFSNAAASMSLRQPFTRLLIQLGTTILGVRPVCFISPFLTGRLPTGAPRSKRSSSPEGTCLNNEFGFCCDLSSQESARPTYYDYCVITATSLSPTLSSTFPMPSYRRLQGRSRNSSRSRASTYRDIQLRQRISS